MRPGREADAVQIGDFQRLIEQACDLLQRNVNVGHDLERCPHNHIIARGDARRPSRLHPLWGFIEIKERLGDIAVCASAK
jgi:hypothetical protein